MQDMRISQQKQMHKSRRNPVHDQPESSARCADQDTAALVPAEETKNKRGVMMWPKN